VRRALTGRFIWDKTEHGTSDAARGWIAARPEEET